MERLVGVVVVCAGVVMAGRSPGYAQCPADDVINAGHRGTGVNDPSNAYPENTIESFLQAQAEGAQMIELDVTHSADGQLVVIHDAKVDRTTDGSGCVGDMTVAELQQLDAAFGTSLEGTGVVIPTLAEVLAATNLDINIEIKFHEGSCSTTDVPRTARDVITAINGDSAGRRFVVSSFSADVLSAVKAENPSIYLGLLTLVPDDASIAASRGFDALNVFSLTVRDPDLVTQIRDMGLDVNVWTENDPFLMSDHLSSGVSMIITDEPDVLETARTDWCDRYEQTQDDGGCTSGRGSSTTLFALILLAVLAMRRR